MKIEPPDAILTCRLLKSCNLSELHFQMVLSTTLEMSFTSVNDELFDTLDFTFNIAAAVSACIF